MADLYLNLGKIGHGVDCRPPSQQLSLIHIYDAARFSEIIGTHRYLCDAKIAVYKQNNIDLRALKDYIKAHCIEPVSYTHLRCV